MTTDRVRNDPDSSVSTMRAERPTTTLSADAIDTIRRHGAETFPYECCGALIDVGGVVVAAFKMENTTSGGAARRFRIGPDGYRLADTHARERGGALVGFYHSHPNEPARPSAYDLEHAWPNLTYVIISVRAGTPADITVWHLRDDRSGFDEGELRWPTGS
jgi:proteasome lid subunit RPN8/RPN11